MVLLSGFALGFLGSLHCLGMCGPLAMLAHRGGPPTRAVFYNLGRMATYAVLGMLFGYFGQGLAIAGYQGFLSIMVGATLVLFAAYPLAQNHRFFAWWTKRAIRPLQQALLSQVGIPWARTALYGMVNGLLPCGLVYLALSMGVSSGSVWQSLLVMVGFGMGTLPAMVGVGIGAAWLQNKPKLRFQQVLAWVTGLVGVMIAIRGMALEIPYISPVLALVGFGQEITVCGQ